MLMDLAAICCNANRRSTHNALSEKLATDPDLSEKFAISRTSSSPRVARTAYAIPHGHAMIVQWSRGDLLGASEMKIYWCSTRRLEEALRMATTKLIACRSAMIAHKTPRGSPRYNTPLGDIMRGRTYD